MDWREFNKYHGTNWYLQESYFRDKHKVTVYKQNDGFRATIQAPNGVTLTTPLKSTMFEIKRCILDFINR